MDYAMMGLIKPLALLISRSVRGTCLIAGGAARNIVTDKPIKDIDILVEDEAHVHRLCDVLGLVIQREPLPLNEENGYDASSNELKVWKCSNYPLFGALRMGLPVDILHVPSVMGRIQKFPDYISRMWFQPMTGGITMTEEAQADLESKRVRYMGSQMRPQRLARLQELYPDWRFKDIEVDTSRSPATKKPREPDHAPFWWDLRDAAGNLRVSADDAMAAVRASCKSHK